MSQKTPLIACIFFCCLSALSSNAAPLSLTDAVQMALRNNPAVAASEQEVATVRAKFAQVDALEQPHISLDAGIIGLSSVPMMNLPQITLPTAAGPMTLSLPALPLANSSVSTGTLSIALPLYTGGRVKYGHAQVADGVATLQAMADAKRRDIAMQTIQAYLSAVLAQRVYEVTDQAFQTIKDHVQSAQALFNHGQIPKYEVIRAQTEQANADRRRLDAHNQADLALAYLQELMSVGKDEIPTLTTNLSGNESMELSFESMVKQALVTSKEMEALTSRDRMYVAAEHEAWCEKNPVVSGIALEKLYMNEQPFSSPATTIGLEIDVPLYDGGLAKAKVAENESMRKSNSEDEQSLQNGIRLAVRKNYLDLLSARQSLSAADQAITLAEEGQRLAQRRFEEEQGTDLEINDAVLALSIAQTNREQARYQYDIAYYGIQMLLGDLIKTVTPTEGASDGNREKK